MKQNIHVAPNAIDRRACALLPQSARLTPSVAAMLLFCRFNRLGCAKSDPMGSPGSLAAAGEGGGAEWAAREPRQARAVSGARRGHGGGEATEGARQRELAAGGLGSAPLSLRRGERALGAAPSTCPACWTRLRGLGRLALKGGLEPRGRHGCPSPGRLLTAVGEASWCNLPLKIRIQ